jgi:SpoIID/LytB domain protein
MMRRALAVVVAATVLAIGPAAPGQAARQFTFYGAGWGHGLGLSQWGAYGLALKGWSHTRILGHFYTGTTVGAAQSSPRTLRIGLVQAQRTIQVKAVRGPVELRVGNPNTGTLVGGEAIAAGETWRIKPHSSGRYRVLNAQGEEVGDCPGCPGHLWGGVNRHLYARYEPLGSIAYSPQAGHSYNRGNIEFNVYKGDGCPSSYCVRLVIRLSPQAYLFGLAEVPNSWPANARKAQAVAARTYAFEKVARVGQRRARCNCGLYDDTSDQVYAGWDKEGSYLGGQWVESVRQTVGEVALYKGSPIQAYYHSSSGGHTEHNENAWGGQPIPYLRGVCDPGDYAEANPNRVWTAGPLSGFTVTTRLRPYTGDIGNVTGFGGIQRGVSGQIIELRVIGRDGTAGISGTELARALGLKGDKVWINVNHTVTGQIRREYDRRMCAPGPAISKQAVVPGGLRQRFQRGSMYENTGRNLTVWLRGPINVKHGELKGARGFLGLPRSAIKPLTGPEGCRSTTCRRVLFEHGSIYFKDTDGVGAHELHGLVLGYFLNNNGPKGRFGFPTSDVILHEDGGTSATFESGTISCSKSGECSG